MAKPDEIEAYAAAGVETIRLWPKWIEDDSLPNRVRAAGVMLHLNGADGSRGATRPSITCRPRSDAHRPHQRAVPPIGRISEQEHGCGGRRA